MARPTTKPFHDIPISRRGVVEALLDEMDAGERTAFEKFSKRLGAIYHYEFHERLEGLKHNYEPVNPDHGALRDDVVASAKGTQALERGLIEVLERGNYRRLSRKEIEMALNQRTLFPIAVTVDFDVYETIIVFARGESPRTAEVKRWFGLRTKVVDVIAYDRVCLYLRFKKEDALSRRERKEIGSEAGMTLLKLFRNIPKADLEMLFPNTRLKMRLLDKLIIGVPALVGGVPLAFKLAPVLVAFTVLFGIERGEVNWTAAAAGLGGIIGLSFFLFRQFDKFKTRKLLFLRMLSESLYFLNIDNNEGVITRLIDEAEEEEHKEALLAYHFLHEEPGLTMKQLDRKVERWLADKCDAPVDFEIDDAMAKLLRFELASDDDGKLSVVEIDEANRILDARWASYLE